MKSAIRSPRAKAHSVSSANRKKSEKKFKKLASKSHNDYDPYDNGSLRSIGSGSLYSAQSASKLTRKKSANGALMKQQRNQALEESTLLRVQLAEVLEENSILKTRLHLELREHHVMESKNRELTEKLNEARDGLRETGSALYKLQQATDQLMNKRDQREIQLLRMAEVNKTNEEKIIDLETRLLVAQDSSKLHYTITNYRKLITEKDDLIRRLEDEQLEDRNRIAKLKRDQNMLIEEKKDLESMLDSRQRRITVLEANINKLTEENTNTTLLMRESSRNNILRSNGNKTDVSRGNTAATVDPQLSERFKELKLMETKFSDFEQEKRKLEERMRMLEQQIKTESSAPKVAIHPKSPNDQRRHTLSPRAQQQQQQKQQQPQEQYANGNHGHFIINNTQDSRMRSPQQQSRQTLQGQPITQPASITQPQQRVQSPAATPTSNPVIIAPNSGDATDMNSSSRPNSRAGIPSTTTEPVLLRPNSRHSIASHDRRTSTTPNNKPSSGHSDSGRKSMFSPSPIVGTGVTTSRSNSREATGSSPLSSVRRAASFLFSTTSAPKSTDPVPAAEVTNHAASLSTTSQLSTSNTTSRVNSSAGSTSNVAAAAANAIRAQDRASTPTATAMPINSTTTTSSRATVTTGMDAPQHLAAQAVRDIVRAAQTTAAGIEPSMLDSDPSLTDSLAAISASGPFTGLGSIDEEGSATLNQASVVNSNLTLEQEKAQQLKDLQREKKLLKRAIYEWTKEFTVQHGREPGREERETEAKDIFKKYRHNAKALKLLEGGNDNNSGLSRGDSFMLSREDSMQISAK